MCSFKCRICNGKTYESLFRWSIPLAADVRSQPENGENYPIEPVVCKECGHVQLKESLTVNMYDEYLYTPSFSKEFQDYVTVFADSISQMCKEGKRVIEIGSSNGYLLRDMQKRGWNVLGFEPSRTLAEAAEKDGIHTEQMYFGSDESAEYIKNWGTPDVIIVRHVMEHLDDLNNIVNSISNILDNGIFVMEVPWLVKIIEEKQFYAFFHEHVSYFSVTVIQKLLNKYGLRIIDIKENNLEGGSIAVYAGKGENWNYDNEKISFYLAREKACCSLEGIKTFSMEINSQINRIKQLVKSRKSAGKTVAAWGAGQRGVSLLNICGLTVQDIDYIIDINKNYWWKYTSGEANFQIVPPEWLQTHFVDSILILATGYADEIISENEAYLTQGGEFVKIIEGKSCSGNWKFL